MHRVSTSYLLPHSSFLEKKNKIEIMKPIIASTLKNALSSLYQIDWMEDTSIIQKTKKEFEGDYTIVMFPFVKQARKSPDAVATEVGEYFKANLHCDYNVVKGFLNLSVPAEVWLDFLRESRTSCNERIGGGKSDIVKN